MPLKDRRSEYSWPETSVIEFSLKTDKEEYSLGEEINAGYSFRISGGLREAFSPEVWTTAWEDYDKFVRIVYSVSLNERKALGSKLIAKKDKLVRKGTFYWSRDPDLPYRIWVMIIPEDGGAPIIPLGVDDAKKKMFYFEGTFKVSTETLGKGTHSIFSSLDFYWSRRSFIEKGRIRAKSNIAEVSVS